MYKEQNIEVMLNYSCNFKCKYCFEHVDGLVANTCKMSIMTDDVAKNIIKYADKFLYKNKDSKIIFNLWGGEPTLSVKLIELFVNTYKDNNNVYFRIFTNGYDIKNLLEIAKHVSVNRFTIQVSYDFVLQKKNRIHKNDTHSSSNVLKNIITLAKLGYNVSTKSTILYEDLHFIEEYYLHFASIKKTLTKFNLQNCIGLHITLDTQNKKFEVATEEFLAKFEEKLKKVAILEIKNKFGFNWFDFDKALCGAGKKFFCVDVDGKVYVCHSALFSDNKEHFYLGNLKEDVDKKVFKNYSLENTDIAQQSEKCIQCKVSSCHRCNVHTYDNSILTKFNDRFHDFSNNAVRCKISHILTKYYHVINKVKKV